MLDLQGKVAIITGGASGIGAATSRLFAEQGMRVLITDVHEEAGSQLAAELGSQTDFCRVDVSREAEVAAAVALVKSRYGRLDVMFNNAGVYGSFRSILDEEVENLERLMAVHLRGVFLGIKHAARVMKSQRGGSIINTASAAGLRAGYSGHFYSAAKSAIIQLTASAAMELGESGVRINCICPGGILTPMVAEALELPSGSLEAGERLAPILANLQPLRRPGCPEDIAQAALFLASEAASFINGHALVVDGGLIGGRQWTTGQQQRQLARDALAGCAAN